MTGAPDHHDATAQPRTSESKSNTSELLENALQPVRYPTNHVLAVLDSREQATAAVAALTAGGFLDSEIQLGSGAASADALDAATGRSGLLGLIVRLAERIGVANEEMETKDRYEQAMRDDHFVIAIAAATDERKDRAAQILREHGAHTIASFGRHTIEYISAPNKR